MYAFIQNGQCVAYPYTVLDYQTSHPNVSVPQTATNAQLEELGIYLVKPVTPPVVTVFQTLTDGTPVLQNGVWTQNWVIGSATPLQVQSNKAAMIAQCEQDNQERMDTFAQTRGYDNMLSACTYATSTTEPYKTEGQYCVSARDASWSDFYAYFAACEAGSQPWPTSFADVIPSLPALQWPV